MMKQVVRRYAWLIAAFVVAVPVLATLLSVIHFGSLRWFNTGLLMIVNTAWMVDYMETRDTLYRRQRRLRLAFASFLTSGMYASLNAALDENGDPTFRVILISISSGILLVSILFHPEGDMGIPAEVEFPWERWLNQNRWRRR